MILFILSNRNVGGRYFFMDQNLDRIEKRRKKKKVLKENGEIRRRGRRTQDRKLRSGEMTRKESGVMAVGASGVIDTKPSARLTLGGECSRLFFSRRDSWVLCGQRMRERRGQGTGQWRCPSEGHGRECGLRRFKMVPVRRGGREPRRLEECDRRNISFEVVQPVGRGADIAYDSRPVFHIHCE